MTHSSTGCTPTAAARAAAAIERAADRATEELAVLQAKVAVRDAELERLQQICDERRHVIQNLSDHADTYRRAAEDRAVLVASLDFELKRVRADLDRTKLERSDALDAAAKAATALDEQRHTFAITSAEVAARDAARERLQEVCDERDRLIEQLSEHCTVYRRAAEERLTLIGRLTDEVESLRCVAEERRLLIAGNDAERRMRQSLDAGALQAADAAFDWRALAEERKRLLDELSAEAERRTVLLAEVTAALEGRTRENEELRGRLTRAS
jgi:chromosome segregation ATPase